MKTIVATLTLALVFGVSCSKSEKSKARSCYNFMNNLEVNMLDLSPETVITQNSIDDFTADCACRGTRTLMFLGKGMTVSEIKESTCKPMRHNSSKNESEETLM